ncbi:DMT family transporter [bacterium]|nr:DMT family transporter [bacterium]
MEAVYGLKGEIAALTAAFSWALATVLFGRAGKSVSPLVLNFAKALIALILLGLTLIVTRAEPLPFAPYGISLLMLSGIIGIGLGDTAYFQALNILGARRTLLMETLAPPITAVLALVLLEEYLGLWAWCGIGLTLAGIIWVIGEREQQSAQHPTGSLHKGLLFGLCFALAQSIGALLSRIALTQTPISPLWSALIRLMASFVFLGLMLALKKPSLAQESPKHIRWPLVMQIVMATFIGTFLGIWLQQISLKYTDAGIAQTLLSTSPVFVLPLAAIYLGDTVSMRAILGALCALAGISLLFAF